MSLTAAMRAAATLALLVSGCATQAPVPSPGALGHTADTAALEGDDRVPARAREVVLQALALIGVPYRYGGSSPESGFDCSGLVRHVVAKAAGLKLPGDARAISEFGVPVEAEAMQPGDLVFFNTLRRPYSHVGIYLGNDRFIHAPSSGGAVEIVSLSGRYWRQRYEGARRLPL
jgi:cell wall-associated NlpC family hydrolase